MSLFNFQNFTSLFFIILLLPVSISAAEIEYYYRIELIKDSNLIYFKELPNKLDSDKALILTDVFKELKFNPAFYTDMRCQISKVFPNQIGKFRIEFRELECEFHSPKNSKGFSTKISMEISCTNTPGKITTEYQNMEFSRYTSAGELIATARIKMSCSPTRKEKAIPQKPWWKFWE